MAQRPWEILKERYIGLEEACTLLGKSIKELQNTVIDVTPGTSTKKRRLLASSPCPSHMIDSLQKLSSNLYECVRNRRKRKVLEATNPILDGSVGSMKSRGRSDKEGVPTLFRKCIVRGLAQLLPIYLRHPEFGIRLFLSNFLMSFVPELGGVWITFRKLRSTNDKGFTYDAEKLGVICFKIDLEVLVFCPSPGCTLLGEVTNIRSDSLEALVFGAWICQISRSQFLEGSRVKRKSQKYKDDSESNAKETETHLVESNGDNNDKDEASDCLDASEMVIEVTDSTRASTSRVIAKGSPIKLMLLRVVCGSSDGKDFYTLIGTLRRAPKLRRKCSAAGNMI